MWVKKEERKNREEEKEMPRQERDYLQTVKEQIRCAKVHGFVTEELAQHIEDQQEAFVRRGQDEETAWNNAVREMGDPVLVGQELDRAHRPRTEWSVIGLTVILLILGASVQYLISMAGQFGGGGAMESGFGNPTAFISYLSMIPFGLAVLLIAYFADDTVLGRWAGFCYGGVLLAVVLIVWFGPTVYGRTQYASEILLLALPVLSGCFWSLRNRGAWGIGFSFLLTLPVMLLALRIPNLLLAAGIYTGAAVMLITAAGKGWFAGSRTFHLLLSGGMTLLTAAVPFTYVMISPYRRTRFLSMLMPGLFPPDELGEGYVFSTVRELLRNAALWGTGPSAENGLSAYEVLPNWDTNFTLTYLISRFGLLVGLVIALAAAVFLIRLFCSLRKQRNVLGYLVSLSVFLTLGMQSAAYLANNFGVFVLGDFSLPLISNGKLSFLINMALVGIFLSAHRSMDLVRERTPEQNPDYVWKQQRQPD